MSLKNKIRLFKRSEIIDERGSFLKIMYGNEISEFTNEMEIYIVSAKPGKSRGGHYHLLANEWFTILRGECKLILEDVNSKEKLIVELNESNYTTLYVPPLVAHKFYNSSQINDFLLLAYTDRKYKKLDTITYNFS